MSSQQLQFYEQKIISDKDRSIYELDSGQMPVFPHTLA